MELIETQNVVTGAWPELGMRAWAERRTRMIREHLLPLLLLLLFVMEKHKMAINEWHLVVMGL